MMSDNTETDRIAAPALRHQVCRTGCNDASSQRTPAGGRPGRAAKAGPADSPYRISVVIPPEDPNAPPLKRPPSSRTIARLKEKAEAAARDVEAARALARLVQPGLRPPAGKLFAVDIGALVIRGPAGGLGTSERIARTLSPLAAGGRHPAAALAPKLAAIGLRICSRKTGLRAARIK